MNDDKKIWNDFRKGEKYALSHIYHQHVQLLFRYGKKFCKDDELIKDVIQELFFDLIRTSNNLGETNNIAYYLMASFRRRLAKSMNKKNELFFKSDQEELEAEIVYSAEHDLIGKEELSHRERTVKNALAELSPKQREILYYRYTCGFDYDKICEIMSLQYDSARKQVSRALKALKKVLNNNQLLLFYLGGFKNGIKNLIAEDANERFYQHIKTKRSSN
ncbi:MAG TPA: sigma-70 family RNA polymerase sigma factor [Mariniphaga sp.]|nr:sigma-70 family RNA polymerase sigma factor [Mariniphaga sp.]